MEYAEILESIEDLSDYEKLSLEYWLSLETENINEVVRQEWKNKFFNE